MSTKFNMIGLFVRALAVNVHAMELTKIAAEFWS